MRARIKPVSRTYLNDWTHSNITRLGEKQEIRLQTELDTLRSDLETVVDNMAQNTTEYLARMNSTKPEASEDLMANISRLKSDFQSQLIHLKSVIESGQAELAQNVSMLRSDLIHPILTILQDFEEKIEESEQGMINDINNLKDIVEAVAFPDFCKNYKELNDSSRLYTNSRGRHVCDNNNRDDTSPDFSGGPGVYRFTGPMTKMATMD